MLNNHDKPISKIVQDLVDGWCEDGLTPVEINNGYCADFANALEILVPGGTVQGVYEQEDLEYCFGGYSPEFKQAVIDGHIGHSAIMANGLFYDAEAPNGVPRFEDLPVNQRAIN